MKRRAGEVGERFAREWVAPLWRALSRPPRLHLIGHSFGATLVTSMALGGVRPASLTLLLAAFSAFAFAPSITGFRRPGFYYPVLAERRVDGPIVVLRSDHDAALGAFYRTVTGSGAVDLGNARDPGRPVGRLGRAATIAASALGAVGARGVGAPELDLLDVQRTGIPQYPIVNVEGSGVVKASELLLAPIATSSTARSACSRRWRRASSSGAPPAHARCPSIPWSGRERISGDARTRTRRGPAAETRSPASP
jgi:hypothetical protein